MEKKTKKERDVSTGIKIAVVGASVAGLAAAAYFLFGPKGKQNQKHLKSWAIKMKGDVIEKLEKAGDVTESVYHEIIDSVAAEYQKRMKDAPEEVQELADDLKKHWKTIGKAARDIKKDVKKVAGKAIKKGKAKVKSSR